MFGLFKKKTPLEIMFDDLCEYYKKCDMAHKVEAGMIINILHSGFNKSFGEISSFLKKSDSEQQKYLAKINSLQGDKRYRVGACFFMVWILSGMIGDSKRHLKIRELMIDLSKIAEKVMV